MTEERNDKTYERKMALPVDDNLMELVDELTAKDDNEVIDLVEETPSFSHNNEDDIIDLEEEAVVDLTEEDLIDLADEVEDGAFNEIIAFEDEQESVSENDEEIIDLKDEEIPNEDPLIELVEETPIDLTEDILAHPSQEEEIIDLMESSEESEEIINLSDAMEEAKSFAENVMAIGRQDEGAQSVDDESTNNPSEIQDGFGLIPPGVDIRQDQIDAALERVIKKLFAERIDSLLTTLIDRTIIRELKELQDRLSGK